MKRLIACLLACMLLIPGMLVYVSAEKGDSIFTYDDSKAYVPNAILMTFKYVKGGIYPDNSGFWASAFGDVYPLIQNLKLWEEYESEEDGKIFTYRIYQLSLVDMYQHNELISLAAYLAESVMSVTPGAFPHCVPPCSISLIEKPVEVEDYRDDIITGDNGALRLFVDHDYVTRDYPWSVEDFPELDIRSVQAKSSTFTTYVDLKLNDSSKESLIDAAQKLAKRYEFLRVEYTTWDGVVPEDPADTTDDTTIPDDTTAPVTDVQTTAPSTSAEETTASPNVEKPTSPPTGDAGRYAAIAFAAALVGAVGVVLYRRRRCG